MSCWLLLKHSAIIPIWGFDFSLICQSFLVPNPMKFLKISLTSRKLYPRRLLKMVDKTLDCCLFSYLNTQLCFFVVFSGNYLFMQLMVATHQKLLQLVWMVKLSSGISRYCFNFYFYASWYWFNFSEIF